MRRWYERLGLIAAGLDHTQPTDFYEDEVLAFFQNCYHLKDWLKGDLASGVSAKEVETYVKQSPNLLLCGGLATGSKHLIIDDPRFDPNTQVRNRHFEVELRASLGGGPSPPPKIAVSYVVEANGVSQDAFALATACLQEWESFLASKGLPTT